MITGKDIKIIRRLANLTQRQLAMMAAVPHNFISQVENGFKSPHDKDRIKRVREQIKIISTQIQCPHLKAKKLGYQEDVGMQFNCIFCGSTITRTR